MIFFIQEGKATGCSLESAVSDIQAAIKKNSLKIRAF
jgi:hypothetical protein